MAQVETRRLFFALWPDPATRAALAEHLQGVVGDMPGRGVPVENWHITVAFLGEIDADAQACAEQAAERAAACPAFALVLNQFGYWPKPQALWFGAADPPPPLLSLVEQLRRGLRACRLPVEDRPFAAHLTLRRKVNRRPPLPQLPAFAWAVRSLALVESVFVEHGVEYRVIRSWPLAATDSDSTLGHARLAR